MDGTIWIGILNEAIPLLLLVALGITLYRGFNKNDRLLYEREDLLKRYLLFRGDKQVHLKILGGDEKARQDLLKTISNSWKNFKRTYDQYLASFAQNTAQTKLFLQIITLGLLFNSLRLLIADFFFFNPKVHLFYTVVRELSSYVLVAISFLLLRIQTHRLLLSKGRTAEMDREILFFPNGLPTGESEGLYNEFDPLEMVGAEDAKKDQNSDWRAESGSRTE